MEGRELKGGKLKAIIIVALIVWVSAAIWAFAGDARSNESGEEASAGPSAVKAEVEAEDAAVLEQSGEALLPEEPKQREEERIPQKLPRSASNVEASDVPNDSGSTIEVKWELSPDDGDGLDNVTGYRVLRSNDPFGGWLEAGTVKPGKNFYRDRFDNPIDAMSKEWYYIIETLSETPSDTLIVRSEVFGPVSARASWFNLNKLNVLILLTIYIILLVSFLNMARREGKRMFVRRIPGIDAIEEAIGRATEMGKPIVYVPGLQDMTDIQTISSMLILSNVAQKVAEYQAELIVPNAIPFVREVAAEVVRQGYVNAGCPEAFDNEKIPYLSQEQFAFTAGVNGIIMREKPAANLYMGTFYAESLLLAETGFAAKAIQVAGTAEVTQIPFFIAACDYTLIGEELHAASAYLSKDPRALSTLKASDWAKVAFIGIILVGVALETVGYSGFSEFFLSGTDLFH